MLNSAATVEETGVPVEPQVTQHEKARAHGAGVMRFAYATGSRPLDGFTIKRGIGIGGFGDVYFALSDAGKEVALKRILRSMDVEVRGASQCLNLKHQNLIALYDIKYDDEGQGWVVMEYVAGESLKDVIERNPNGMPEDDVIGWFRGIASGVAYLHDHGIIHRDLKPGNIFVDQETVKIGDYGLSKYISCSRRSGQTESVGTFHYMAPEIGKGIYGKEIDVYALGVILCEMLTGAVPIDGESSQEIIMKHLTADPELGAVKAQYRPILQRALAKDPANRFATVSEMLLQLENAHSGITEIPPIRREQPVRPPSVIDNVAAEEGIYFGPVREIAPAANPAERRVEAAQTPIIITEPTEPVAAAVHRGYHSILAWWKPLTTPVKLLVLISALALLTINSTWIVPLAAVCALIYLPYLGLYCLAKMPAKPKVNTPPRAESPPTPQTIQARRRQRFRRVNWQHKARSVLSERTLSERLGELNGSLLSAAIVASVVSLFMVLVNGLATESVYTWTFFAWLSLTSVAGSWMILTLSKLWEGSEGEQFRRRFVMLVAGLALGLTAFGATEFLALRPSAHLAVESLPTVDAWAAMYHSDQTPKLPAFLVYFAGLFATTRWWLQSDPLRMARLSIWATAICILWAGIVHLLWPFPQPWGLMLAATISIAVQLSAPWMPSQERNRIRSQVMEA